MLSILVSKFEEALEEYTKAIDLDVADGKKAAIYYTNRAFAQLKLENYGFALEDSTKAIGKDPTFAKGYYRRGGAYFALGKYKSAAANFKRVLDLLSYTKRSLNRFSSSMEIKTPMRSKKWQQRCIKPNCSQMLSPWRTLLKR